MLLGVAAIVGAAVAVGLMLLIVPGVIAYLIWVFAAPVGRDGAGVGAASRCAAASLLTRGHRGRILGAVAVTMITGAVASAIVGARSPGPGRPGGQPAPLLVVTEFVSVLVGGLAAPGPARSSRCCTSTSGSAPSTWIRRCGRARRGRTAAGSTRQPQPGY